ncbi:putative S-adenosyl-L-methionine-dependent methyltransferase [Dillenia turbinata]|uniref:S-adenosyl-L-methionine-dependent methyltransferase n=1 Tax=Dillenia turbinata TaxID=194707 RepID=A0AAN8VQH6_9MAGN
MAMGKYSRVDGKKSSNCCSTVTVVVLVAVCLVGVWMMMSSSVVPLQNSEVVVEESSKEVKESISEGGSQQFEDTSGQLPDDGVKEYGNAGNESNSDESQTESQTNKESESTQEENQEENLAKENTEEAPKTNAYSDQNGDNGEGVSKSKDANSGSEGEETKTDGSESNESEQRESEENSGDNTSITEENGDENKKDNKEDGQTDENADQNQGTDTEQSSEEKQTESEENSQGSNDVFPAGEQSEVLKESNTQDGAFSTQAAESKNEKESQKSSISENGYSWRLCNVTAGPDYIPCLDNIQAIRQLHSTKHYEHRQRHCPDEAPSCLVPLPEGYKIPIKWPKSREKIWYYNVPHTKLAEVKGHQNWVKVTGEYLTFPGGGTQFKNGALHYIDFIQESLPDIAWGKRTRVILDVGCGVASFGGYLFERDVLAMSFAPKDEHEAQVQFALERGIPAISAVMGTTRLPFPANVFDVVHCARCRVPWHIEGGKLLLELNRLLRPGGFFVWSATPVYQKLPADVEIWKAMKQLTKSMCWNLLVIKKDKLNGVGAAIFRKPTSNECYDQRGINDPPLCQKSDDPNAAWNIQLQACMHRVPVDESERGSRWPEQWPVRVEMPPYWLASTQIGVYGKSAPEDFNSDYEHWKHVVSKSYLSGMGINWSSVRNVMDMRAVYGGFAAALKDMSIWVMNVVPIDSPDTLPIIFERGLFGIYHDWCESFSTYPRSYDLLHADHLFSNLKKRCKLVAVIAEVDRILRPGGKLIVRDKVDTISEVESMARSLQWKIRLIYSQENEGLLCVEKTMWRPSETETIMSAIA